MRTRFKIISSLSLLALLLTGCNSSGGGGSDNSFTVTWKNWDGSVLETDTNVAYGSTPSYDSSTPMKSGTAQYTYTFSGWSPSVSQVTSDAAYIAQFSDSINSYTVTWKNWDDSVLSVDIVESGSLPIYTGVDPVRPDDSTFTYTFKGWTPEVKICQSDCTYYAIFEANKITKTYSVIWKDFDGSLIQSKLYNEDELIHFDANFPIRGADSEYLYEFTGWDIDVEGIAIKQNYILTATYNKYRINDYLEIIAYHGFYGYTTWIDQSTRNRFDISTNNVQTLKYVSNGNLVISFVSGYGNFTYSSTPQTIDVVAKISTNNSSSEFVVYQFNSVQSSGSCNLNNFDIKDIVVPINDGKITIEFESWS